MPIIARDTVIGSIDLEDLDHENAYGDAEVRLLSTIASSVGVALESALLFEETERLLRETEQRAGELAVINSIQQGISAELEFQAIIDLVGDKLPRRPRPRRHHDRALRRGDRSPQLRLRVRERANASTYLRCLPTPGGTFETIRRTRQPQRIDTRREVEEIAGYHVSRYGRRRCRCSMFRSSPTIVSSA